MRPRGKSCRAMPPAGRHFPDRLTAGKPCDLRSRRCVVASAPTLGVELTPEPVVFDLKHGREAGRASKARLAQAGPALDRRPCDKRELARAAFGASLSIGEFVRTVSGGLPGGVHCRQSFCP